MINLSDLRRTSPECPWIERVQLWRDPDIYHADGVRDFRDGREELTYPWYKRHDGLRGPRAYVVLYDVRLSTHAEIPEREFVVITDRYGDETLVAWCDPDTHLLPSLTSPTLLHDAADPTFGVSVWSVFLMYLLDFGMEVVVEVQRTKPDRAATAPDQILETVRSLELDFAV